MLGAGASAIHSTWLHTIGNLTLTGYNPELGNRSYPEKRITFALSHFDLNRCFGGYENWTPVEIEERGNVLFEIAVQLWPRPDAATTGKNALEKRAPAAFHGDCVKIVQHYLGINLSKLSQTRYESGDAQVRLTCAVSATHNESGDVPYFWFALHAAQLAFLATAKSPYVCLGCSSSQTTLLVPLPVIQSSLSQVSVTKTEDRHYWHLVIQKKAGKFLMRLLSAKDGPDLTEFNLGSTPRT